MDYQKIDRFLEEFDEKIEILHEAAHVLYGESKTSNYMVKKDVKKAIKNWNKNNPTIKLKIPMWEVGLIMLGIGNEDCVTQFLVVSENNVTQELIQKIVGLSPNFNAFDESVFIHIPTNLKCSFMADSEHPENFERIFKLQNYLTVVDENAAKVMLGLLEIFPFSGITVLSMGLEYLMFSRHFPTFKIIDRNYIPIEDPAQAILDCVNFYAHFDFTAQVIIPYFGVDERENLDKFLEEEDRTPMMIYDLRLGQQNLTSAETKESCQNFQQLCWYIVNKFD